MAYLGNFICHSLYSGVYCVCELRNFSKNLKLIWTLLGVV